MPWCTQWTTAPQVRSATGAPDSLPHPKILLVWSRRAFDLTPAERQQIRETARQFAANRYDHPRAVRAFLKHVAPWLDQQLEGNQST
jgi:hypothetical protein